MSEASAEAPEPKLMYEIEVNLPNLPKGELVQIPGLGTYENRGTYDVDVDQADAFRAYHVYQDPVYDNNGAIVGAERTPGPTLLQASKTMYGVEVTTYAKQKPADDKNDNNENQGGEE